MVEKRKPLILASTKTLLNALSQNPNNNNSNSLQSGNCHVNTPLSSSSDSSPLFVQVQAGILKFPNNKNEIPPRISSLDHSSLIGLPVAILKRLAITSGTLVCLF